MAGLRPALGDVPYSPRNEHPGTTLSPLSQSSPNKSARNKNPMIDFQVVLRILGVGEENMMNSVPQSTSVFRSYGWTFLVILIQLIGLSF